MSPKRSHSPGSMNPNQEREAPAQRTAAKGHWGQATAFELGRALAVSRFWPRVGCGGHELSERAAHPCAGLADCGSGFSGSCTTPFASPPPGGAGAAARGL